jgi:hypothetical protein
MCAAVLTLKHATVYNTHLPDTHLPAELPPGLLVLDVRGNGGLTGSLPSPLPASLHYLSAGDNALSGSLPELPRLSLLSYLLLGNNRCGLAASTC